jgi:hypothetical protein
MLLLPGVFYIWSVHSSGTPVFVPELEPYTRYNTRYALALLPFTAFAAAAIVTLLPERIRGATAVALMLGVAVAQYREGVPISWEEARVGSEARRAWTAEAAAYMKENYQRGSGIVFWFSDLAGVFRQAGIPIREGLYQDNSDAWKSDKSEPADMENEAWALASAGDPVDKAVQRRGTAYQLAKRIEVKGAPAILIYRRTQ